MRTSAARVLCVDVCHWNLWMFITNRYPPSLTILHHFKPSSKRSSAWGLVAPSQKHARQSPIPKSIRENKQTCQSHHQLVIHGTVEEVSFNLAQPAVIRTLSPHRAGATGWRTRSQFVLAVLTWQLNDDWWLIPCQNFHFEWVGTPKTSIFSGYLVKPSTPKWVNPSTPQNTTKIEETVAVSHPGNHDLRTRNLWRKKTRESQEIYPGTQVITTESARWNHPTHQLQAW